MNAAEYWQLFLETGAPEAYMSYSNARKKEEQHVSDGSWYRPESYGLQ